MRLPECAAVALIASLGSACGIVSEIGPTTCDRSEETNPPILYTDGEVVGDVYRSAAFDSIDCPAVGDGGSDAGIADCELLYFPGGMRYKIQHKLGVVPSWWQFYLSFDQFGAQTGTIAPAAGDQAVLRAIDCDDIVVVNASCSEYWLLVVAGRTGDGGPPNPCDAGATP